MITGTGETDDGIIVAIEIMTVTEIIGGGEIMTAVITTTGGGAGTIATIDITTTDITTIQTIGTAGIIADNNRR
jgi:hypothetical protein